MGNDWDGDDEPPPRGMFARPPVEPVTETFVYQDRNHKQFLITRDPLTGLNSSPGEVDEKGWPMLRPTDERE